MAMNAQRRDLIVSRAKLENEQGEEFGCFVCGALLPPVRHGRTSDACDACDDAITAEEAAYRA